MGAGDGQPDDRASSYREDIGPEHAQTPDSVARDNGAESVDTDADRPTDLYCTEGTLGDDSDTPASVDQSGGVSQLDFGHALGHRVGARGTELGSLWPKPAI